MDPYRDPRDADRYQTVRDMATRDDPYAEERMRGSIGAITDNMALMTEKLAVLIPVLSRSMIDLERRMDEAMRPSDYDLADYALFPASNLWTSGRSGLFVAGHVACPPIPAFSSPPQG